MRKIFFFLICMLAVQGLPGFSQKTGDAMKGHALNICSVIAAAGKYDGTQIVVDGDYRIAIHGAVLTGAACMKTYASLKVMADYNADKHASAIMKRLLGKDKSQPVAVVLRGTFRVAQKGQCLGGDLCASYEIEVTDLLSAQPVPFASQADGLR